MRFDRIAPCVAGFRSLFLLPSWSSWKLLSVKLDLNKSSIFLLTVAALETPAYFGRWFLWGRGVGFSVAMVLRRAEWVGARRGWPIDLRASILWFLLEHTMYSDGSARLPLQNFAGALRNENMRHEVCAAVCVSVCVYILVSFCLYVWACTFVCAWGYFVRVCVFILNLWIVVRETVRMYERERMRYSYKPLPFFFYIQVTQKSVESRVHVGMFPPSGSS